MSRRMIIESDACTGCISCVLACSIRKEGLFSVARSRIRVDRTEERGIFVPRVCIQCDARACIGACSLGALAIDDSTGAITVDSERCTGCRSCVEACPFGGIHFDDERSLPLVCDLCGGDPACVRACVLPRAIRFDERGEQ